MEKEIIEYSVQLKKVRSLFGKRKIESSQDIVAIMRQFYDYDDRERLYVLLVDSRKNIIGINLVAVGAVDSVGIHPREIFKPAILLGASAIVMVHNHPWGDVQPSDDDKDTTDQIIECGELLDIPLMDHIIFSENDYYSFYDEMEENKQE